MLYISRRIGDNYGVVDTDDDVEEEVTYIKLRNIVLHQGIPIVGAKACGDMDDSVYMSIDIFYQDPRYAHKAQVKLATMYGVEIRLFKGEVSYIKIDGSVCPDKVPIRLSNFCTKFSFGVPIVVEKGPNVPTFVFDDNIEIEVGEPTSGTVDTVFYDLRELSDTTWIYKELIYKPTCTYIGECLRDRSVNLLAYHAIECLYTENDSARFSQAMKERADYRAINRKIAEMLQPLFEYMNEINCDDSYIKTISKHTYERVRYVDFNDGVRIYAYSTDYETLIHLHDGVFSFLKSYSGTQPPMLARFENYLIYYSPSTKIRNIYMRLCQKLFRYLVWRYED